MLKVSVIIPTYNAGKFLSQAIQSVLGQTYSDIECIVVDDGSTDNTIEIISIFKGKIQYILQDNQGPSVARNTGIQNSTGDLIAFLDADDYWTRDKIFKQVVEFKDKPKLGLLYTQVTLVDINNTMIKKWLGQGTPWPSPGKEAFARCILLDDFIIAGLSTMMINRKCFESYGLFQSDIVQAEEWPLALAISKNWQIDLIKEPLAFYRVYGSYLPEKLNYRKAQTTWEYIVTQGLEKCSEQEIKELKNRALALVYLNGAFVDYGVELVQDAKGRLLKALELDRNIFYESVLVFLKRLTDFSVHLRDAITPIQETIHYLNFVFDNLPDELMFLSYHRNDAISSAFVVSAFEAYSRDDFVSTMRSVCHALIKDKRMVQNRGLLSIFLKSIIRKKNE